MNDNNNKTPRKLEESSKSVVGSSRPVRSSGWRKLLTKRWVFPAAYMAAAAIIVTILWVNSGTEKDKTQQAVPETTEVGSDQAVNGQVDSEDVPVIAGAETLQWPVSSFAEMTTTIPFYDSSASLEDRAAAVVEYDNTYKPHMAVDLARKDAKDFDVLAALSGEVTVAEQTPTNNFEVQIKHSNGLVTVYQSLTNLAVHVGDKVVQGDRIGSAGQSELESAEGVHVHFEVRNNGKAVNPSTLLKAE
ncbi:MAG: M23 family metallopeptidase [Candidatus Cohnella colombiensis]|uniref:M23 family metallopeptidase n=1 Tax=Candidatus Cohnella colombiensis TaxID=3121368 RepID=A0AA95JA42_9BACL|nr:MAG: M23 family metallopeptidase [Cohnella sp.]